MKKEKQASSKFPATRWTLVLRSHKDTPEKIAALEELCQIYWPPIYAFARLQGASPEDAEDLTQGFFHNFLHRNSFEKTDPTQGSLRSYLLRSFKNFSINEWKKEQTQKRGGDTKVDSIDQMEAEERFQKLPSDQLTPDQIYDRVWATTLLDQVFVTLQRRYEENDKPEFFSAIRPCITPGGDTLPYAEIGEKFEMSEGAVKTAVYRLRQECKIEVRQAVAETLDTVEDVDAELKALLAIMEK